MISNLMHSLESHVEVSSFSRKQVIYRNGESAKVFYHIKQGQIGLYQVSEGGKESLLRIYGPGSYFGYRSLFTGQNYPSTARAMLNSIVVKINVNDFKSLDEIAPNLASYLMKEVCYELGEAEKRLMQFNGFNARKRILDTIAYFFEMHPDYPWTYREIAEYSGTDITTVIRYCKGLKETGLLRKDSRKPTPVDLNVLADYRLSLV
ncbi:hypothetical protein BCU70_01895 [Vibrio sp. 10N.286.49.C2]|uniref:Crp/Fnr family transcriptional regulator n=1 Tax=unclassified Vibrio TaxID=2614977 RepID=UPI000C83C231|nr:hypothetical protein BCU70_01895 [Vibrio sp. 10N.286.49.C2]PMH53731.1 hypothetical protein BCU66_12940 [Vibrio sp. 10N.286.49.B1]PMH81253.1 hypothetical protein BCU58_21725 [Vibrio sp. 10N.286.48.B7]